MVVVMIWQPTPEYHYGHAALATNNYHISIWPKTCITKKNWSAWNAASPGVGVEAILICHQDLDFEKEGGRVPNQYKIPHVADADVDHVFEELLQYNEIVPDMVTRSSVVRAWHQEGRKKLKRVLPNTRYTYMPELVYDKRKTKSAWMSFLYGPNRPFYEKAQSCVSLVFNIVEMADRKPDVGFIAPRQFSGSFERNHDFRVPWFETQIVQQLWKGELVL